MALTPTIKAALDNMVKVDKALVMLYIFGVDDTALATSIGRAFVQEFYPELDPDTMSNNNMALAILLRTRGFVKDVYVSQQAVSATEQARAAAAATAAAAIPYGDIGVMP